MHKRIYTFSILTMLVLLLPLGGVLFSSASLHQYITFPPLTHPAPQPPFSWPVFLLLLLFSAAVVFILAAAGRHGSGYKEKVQLRHQTAFTWWGWISLASLLLFWIISWSDISLLEPLRRHSFFPLWLSFVIFLNALCLRWYGRCPLQDKPLAFLMLFPLSSLFWWFFEYLNQFVDNWYYVGVDYGPLLYSVHASLSFSTVLPAVFTLRTILLWHPRFSGRFHSLPALDHPSGRRWNLLAILVACLGLFGVGMWPHQLFFILWLAPLLLLPTLMHLGGLQTQISDMASGDWRPAVSSAMAALICGFFWEMWNYWSLAKWIYAIPYVERFHIFEMPLLGYLGYLPFGIFCVEVVEYLWGRDRARNSR